MDHGDSIEVVTHESAWQVVDFVEATTDYAGEERVEERVEREPEEREPEEREEGRHPIERDAKDDCQAHGRASTREADVAGHAREARRNVGLAAGRHGGEAGRSGCRETGRRREGSYHDLTCSFGGGGRWATIKSRCLSLTAFVGRSMIE